MRTHRAFISVLSILAPALLGSAFSLHALDTTFRRGDVNADGELDISDGITLLEALFLGGTQPTCADAADADDSGVLDISDAIFTLEHLYLGGPPPPTPFSACGLDPTDDQLGCVSFALCVDCLGNIPPTVEFLSPEPGSIIESGDVEVSVNAEDSDGEIVAILIDGVRLPAGTTTQSVPLSPGPNLIRVEVIDNCGRTAFADLPLGRTPILPRGDLTAALAVDLREPFYEEVRPTFQPLLDKQLLTKALRDGIHSSLSNDPATADGKFCGKLTFYRCESLTLSQADIDIAFSDEGLGLSVYLENLIIKLKGRRPRCCWQADDRFYMYVRGHATITATTSGCTVVTESEFDAYDVEFTEMDFFCDLALDEIFVGKVRSAVEGTFESQAETFARGLLGDLTVEAQDLGPLTLEPVCSDTSGTGSSFTTFFDGRWLAKSVDPTAIPFPGTALSGAPFPAAFVDHTDGSVCVSVDMLNQALGELAATGSLRDEIALDEYLPPSPLGVATLGDLADRIEARLGDLGVDEGAALRLRLELQMSPRLRLRDSGASGAVPVRIEIRELVGTIVAADVDLLGFSFGFDIDGRIEWIDEALVFRLDTADGPDADLFPDGLVDPGNIEIGLAREIIDVPDELAIQYMETTAAFVGPAFSALLDGIALPALQLPGLVYEVSDSVKLDVTIENADLVPVDTDGGEADWICAELHLGLAPHVSYDVVPGLAAPEEPGAAPSIAINVEDVVVGVHEQPGGLLAGRVGEASIYGVTWGASLPLGTGFEPAVAINDPGDVAVLYRDSEQRLICRVGHVEIQAHRLELGEARPLEIGSSPGVTLLHDGTIVEMHEASPGQGEGDESMLYYRVGVLAEVRGEVEWGPRMAFRAGEQVAVTSSLSFEDTHVRVVVAYRHDDLLHSVVGRLDPGTLDIQWGESVSYGRGLSPSIAIAQYRADPRLIPFGVLVEAHEAGDSLSSRIATISNAVGDPAGLEVQWERAPRRFETGRAPSIAANDRLVVTAHQSLEDFSRLRSSVSYLHDRSTWMEDLPGLLDLPLWQVTLPGSHDSGTYKLTSERAPCGEVDAVPEDLLPIVPAFARTQAQSILAQLYGGIRYFDLRPLATDGEFHAYHGVVGPRFDDILAQIAEFMDSVDRELVIASVSHFCAAGLPFPHERLQELFQSRLGGYLYRGPTSGLMTQSLGEFVENGPRVLVLYGDEVAEGAEERGFWSYPRDDFKRCCGYTNTPIYEEMVQDQLQKLEDSPGSPQKLFNLSWLLTIPENPEEAVSTVLGLGLGARDLSLRALTRQANRHLGQFVRDHALDAKVNILYVDFFEDARATDLAIELNVETVARRQP